MTGDRDGDDRPGPRLRRDPRAERQGRRRPAEPAPAARQPDAEGGGFVIVAEPACFVFAVPDLADGLLSPHDQDVLAGARQLADAIAGAVTALAFARRADLGAAGADRVITWENLTSAVHDPESRAAAILSAVERWQPRHVLFPETGIGGDLGRRVAASLQERPAGSVVRLRHGQAVRRARGGSVERTLTVPRIILLEEGAVDRAAIGKRGEARPLEGPVTASTPRIVDRGLLPVDPASVPLSEAELILGAGNGVSDWAAFHAAAAALGASEGGSRVVCDAGLLARDRQIGASGMIVDPRCYLAFGIAGAVQHLEGVQNCKHVVAVNTDLHAPMIKRANLAVIADANAVLRALAEMVQWAHGQG